MSYYDDASLVVIPSGYKTSKVYAEKPTDGSGDLAFTRTGDTATRVNSAGLIEKVRTNLALYSEDFTNASWTKAVTVTANAGTAPNGTTTADLIYPSANSSNSVIFNGVTIANSTEYTNSIYVKASGKTWTYIRGINDGVGVWFDVANGVLGTTQSGVSGTITSVGSGWYRCSVTQTSSSTTGRLVVLVVDGNGSTAVTASGTSGLLIWGAQIETGVATDYIPTTTAAVSVGMVANTPRLDFLGSTCPRLLLEPQRTNLATFSESFDNGVWSKNSVNISANSIISPDGFSNADKVEDSTNGNANHLVASGALATAGVTYTWSAFMKKGDYNYGQLHAYDKAGAIFDLNAGTVISSDGINATITNYGSGWYRCTYTFVALNTGVFINASKTSTSAYSYSGTIGSGIYIWGAQLEAGAYATSYIPTLASASTRSADACSKTGISSLIGQTEGTLFVDFNINGFGSPYASAISVNDGVPNNYIWLTIFSNGNLRAEVWNGSVQAQIIYSGAVVGGRYKMAFGYKTNDFVMYVNGTQVGTDNSGATFSGTTLSRIDNNLAGAAGNETSQSTNQTLLFKTRLTNAQLAELTTL